MASFYNLHPLDVDYKNREVQMSMMFKRKQGRKGGIMGVLGKLLLRANLKEFTEMAHNPALPALTYLVFKRMC